MSLQHDPQLLTRVANGDTGAMQSIYERHHDALYRFIRSRGCDESTAMDVLHDAMLDVWKHAKNYRGTGTVQSWIFTIARNKFVDRVRTSARIVLVDTTPDIADLGPSAEDTLKASQNAAYITSCLDTLSKPHRSAIYLAFYQGLNYEEIAEIEGVSVGTVKSRIFHAKEIMRHGLGKFCNQEKLL